MGILIYRDNYILQFRVCLLDTLVSQYRILVFMRSLLRRQIFLEAVTCRPSRVLFVSAFCFGKPKSCHRVSLIYTLSSSLEQCRVTPAGDRLKNTLPNVDFGY